MAISLYKKGLFETLLLHLLFIKPSHLLTFQPRPPSSQSSSTMPLTLPSLILPLLTFVVLAPLSVYAIPVDAASPGDPTPFDQFGYNDTHAYPIDDALFETFKFVSWYAAAAYCEGNNDSLDTPLICSTHNCPLVEAAGATILSEFEDTPNSTTRATSLSRATRSEVSSPPLQRPKSGRSARISSPRPNYTPSAHHVSPTRKLLGGSASSRAIPGASPTKPISFPVHLPGSLVITTWNRSTGSVTMATIRVERISNGGAGRAMTGGMRAWLSLRGVLIISTLVISRHANPTMVIESASLPE